MFTTYVVTDAQRLKPNAFGEMQTLCREKGVEFLSSTFTVRSTIFLVDKMGLETLKLASSRIVEFDLLDYVNSRADHVKTVYLSTGGSTLA